MVQSLISIWALFHAIAGERVCIGHFNYPHLGPAGLPRTRGPIDAAPPTRRRCSAPRGVRARGGPDREGQRRPRLPPRLVGPLGVQRGVKRGGGGTERGRRIEQSGGPGRGTVCKLQADGAPCSRGEMGDNNLCADSPSLKHA